MMNAKITMAIPSLPTPLEQLGNRRFSFYPPILGVENNEWLFERATWPEVLVTNAHSGVHIAIPRRFVGEVSRIEEPVVIVGLLKELEYREGSVWPHRRQVLQMPIAVGAETYATRSQRGPAPVIGISLHSETRPRRGRMIVGALVAGILASLAVAGALRDGHHLRTRPFYRQIPRQIPR